VSNQTDLMDSRFERWLKVSVGMARFEPHMMPLVQQLGRLDAQLIDADSRWIEITRSQQATPEQGDDLHRHITQSYLWVLGAYELVRTLSQKMNAGVDSVPGNVREAFHGLKKRFARIRMPLAKMEAVSGFSEEDSHIAYPGIHQNRGVAWQLNPTTIISRRQLSDEMLGALELARREKLRQQAELFRAGTATSKSPGEE